jgi:hypothetical protein
LRCGRFLRPKVARTGAILNPLGRWQLDERVEM